MVLDIYIYTRIVNGFYKQTYASGAPRCRITVSLLLRRLNLELRSHRFTNKPISAKIADINRISNRTEDLFITHLGALQIRNGKLSMLSSSSQGIIQNPPGVPL